MKYVFILIFLLCSCSSSFVVNGHKIETKKKLNDLEIKGIILYGFCLAVFWNMEINNPLHK